jgi:hypothetical protein
MGWLEDVTKPIFGRVWQAFLGIGHTMEVRICTDPHFYAAVGSSHVVSEVASHLDLKLRVWNKGGPDVTIVDWHTRNKENYTITGYPTGDLVLEKSGKVVTIDMYMYPKAEPLTVKVGDSLKLTLDLSNGINKHLKTKVK